MYEGELFSHNQISRLIDVFLSIVVKGRWFLQRAYCFSAQGLNSFARKQKNRFANSGDFQGLLFRLLLIGH